MTANLPMGGLKIVGMADPTVATDAATKNYVDTATGAFFSTGDVKLSYKTSPDTGWLMMNDTTFGNAGSGATNASANYQALYFLLWNNISSPSSNAYATVTGGLGASASADWAGLKPMALPKALGRALAVAGAGSGLTSRLLGQSTGAEGASLVTANLPPYTPAGSISISATAPLQGWAGTTGSQITTAFSMGSNNGPLTTLPVSLSSQTFTGTAQGGTSAAFSIMPPISFINAMVKY